jgi:hypothetical protein
MLRSFWPESKMKLQLRRGWVAAFCLMAATLIAAPGASAADFTMTVAANLSPPAVAPGGTSAAQITIVTGSGFVGPITFGCTVTPSIPQTVDPPACVVSPASMIASGAATATLTTQQDTTTVSYGITITATDSSGTVTSQTLDLTVLSVVSQFTITVETAVAPASVPAGSGGQGVISVNPVNGYRTPSSGGITLYCASITPLVTLPPFCSFTSESGSSVIITGSNPVPATITIGTLGTTTQQCENPRWRHVYALWLGLPMLSLIGLGAGAGGNRSRKAWVLVGIFVVGAGFLLMPSCSNTNHQTCTPNGVTPANTYSFTVVGVDGNGVASSNTGTSSSGSTVSLTVTAPVP